MVQRFVLSLKTEHTAHKLYRTRDEANGSKAVGKIWPYDGATALQSAAYETNETQNDGFQFGFANGLRGGV